MAYIFQHRRDTIENWNSVNPVLADAEIGFILDLDENGKQKSSLYKIGDGSTAWRDLPLFGFGGDVYDDFTGDDLNTSVASRQAVLNELDKKISKIQLIEEIDWSLPNEFLELPDEELSEEQKELKEQFKSQIISKYSIVRKIQSIDEKLVKIGTNLDELNNLAPTISENNEAIKTLGTALKDVEDYVWGYEKETEETDPETGEIIKEIVPGVEDKFTQINNRIDQANKKIQIMSEDSFGQINDFTIYPEGTLFFTYKND